MTALLVLFALVVAGGIGSAAGAYLVDRRPRPDLAREELARGLDATDAALLTGGVARAVDVAVLALVDRELVRADGGTLTVSDEVDRLLDTPMDSPDYRPPYSFEEASILVSVRARGGEGLDAVRRDVLKWKLRSRLRALAGRGLLVTPLRRQWGPMTVAGPTLVGMFFCSMGFLSAGPIEEIEVPASLTILGWLPVTILTAVIWSRRPGYHGPDPRTARGRDISDVLVAELPGDAAQAQRVAVGGFAAMTDDALRRDVQGNAVESRWSVPSGRRRAAAYGVNAALAIDSGMTSDGGGDGGGDSGGGD
ncbi:hypothetical protein E1262_12365 [Jiangella aurantiaca]|uniref:TIGR04222 domain-containing membrane protein n=1 Tax=Jiangella aurantiaca TaxID=2530373 RepID=A0A4R5AAV6_9ACTN|nr:hypothetical protein [Jiangella aurantiaca]TDD69438.1 hypothetical protein E1262_12365 [Jiangella aurantiaca]